MRRKSRVRCFYLSQVRFQSRCWRRIGKRPRRATTPTPDTSSVQRIWIKGYFGFFVMYQLYSTLLHLPPLRFHCVGGWWDRTQDSAISALAVRCSSHWAYISSTLGYISSTLGHISSTLDYNSSTLWIHGNHKLIRTLRCRMPQFITPTQSMVYKMER